MDERNRTRQNLVDEISLLKQRIKELEQSNEAHKQSLQNYRSLTATVDSMFILDRNYIMISANEHFLGRMQPHTFGPIIGKSIDAIFHPSQITAIRECVDAVFSTRKHYYDETWARYYKMYFARTFSPVFDENGNVTAVTVVSKDSTKRKLAEIALQESEAKYRALASTMDSVFLVDRERKYLFVNDNYLNSHMVSVVGRRYDELHDEKDTKRFADAVEYVFDSGLPCQDEHFGKFVGKFWLRTFGPVKNDEGKTTAVVVSARDIQDRKQAEETLRESEAKYHALASTVDRLVLVDRNCTILFANQAFIETFKASGSIIGRAITSLQTEEGAKVFAKSLALVFAEGKPYQEYWFGIRRKKHWLRTFTPVKDQEGNIFAVTVSYKDITELKRVETELMDALKEKDLLLREVHHRVKNNMQVISSLLKLQAASIKNPEMTEVFERSQKRIQSMALIHEQLYRTDNFSKISMADYTQDLTRMLMSANASDATKITLVVEAADVYTDLNNAIPCGLILNELITNTLKYAFPADHKGELRITITETEQQETLIVVSDNGIGLPDSVDPNQSQGIGLYLVSGLVKNQLGGQMEVLRDRGTEFRIMFPA